MGTSKPCLSLIPQRSEPGLPALLPVGGHLGGHLLPGAGGHGGHFTHFTEEGFCALISLVFIYDAMGKMLTLTHAYPIQRPGSPAYGCQYTDPGGGRGK